MSRDKGATADEMLAVLVKAFPDREADGMRKTVLIQANKTAPRKRSMKSGVGFITAAGK
jgi:hypothetical protein